VGGITTYEAKRLLQGLRGFNVIGADLVEVSPPFDSAGITALAGAQMMFEMPLNREEDGAYCSAKHHQQPGRPMPDLHQAKSGQRDD
jgi:hypothetical protein